MRAMRLGELLSQTNTSHVPTFQLRAEFFRLPRGAGSLRMVDSNRSMIELELERVPSVAYPDAVVVLQARDVLGGEAPLYVNGRPV